MAWSCWPYNSLSSPLGPAQPRRPQEEIPFFLGVVGFVLVPLPPLGHPCCRQQRWRCPDLRSSLYKIFGRERVSSNSENCAISVKILRAPGGANPPDPGQELRPHSPKIPIRWIDPTVSL